MAEILRKVGDMDNGSQSELTLKRLPCGGYVVGSYRRDDEYYASPLLFASADIDEALGFIRDKVKPIAPAQSAG